MRPKSIILLMLALGCGLVASIGISQVMDRRGTQPEAVETEAIYIAKVDINVGDLIETEMVNLDDWPKEKLPLGAMTSLEDLLDRRPRTKIYAGEPILEKKLRAKNAADDPSQQIPKGFRVVPVRVGLDAGGAGLITPGDRVDVQLFVKRKRGSGVAQTQVRTVLTNMRVFSVNKEFRNPYDSGSKRVVAKTVSLLATPEQANKLTLATRLGTIKMIIRNPDDTSEDTSAGTTIDDLFGQSRGNRDNERRSAKPSKAKSSFGDWLAGITKATSLSAKQKPLWKVEVLQGSQRSEVLFDDNDRLIRGRGNTSYKEPLSQPASSGDERAKTDETRNEPDANAIESDDIDDEEITEDNIILPGDSLEEDSSDED